MTKVVLEDLIGRISRSIVLYRHGIRALISEGIQLIC